MKNFPKLLMRAGLSLASVIVLVSAPTAMAASSYTWTDQTGSGAKAWQDVASSADGSKLVAGVYNGNIWTSSDYGASWIEHTGPGVNTWRPVASSADGTKLAIGAWLGSNIWTSWDSGASWTEQTGTGSQHWSSIASSADGSKLVAVTSSGAVWYSQNSGVTWANRTGTSSGIQSISISTDGGKWAGAAAGGGVWTSNDQGTTWFNSSVTTGGGIHVWQNIASSSDGSKLVVVDSNSGFGTEGNIWTSSDSGATWTERTGAGSNKWQG